MAKRYLIIPQEPEALAARIRDARYKRDFWFDACFQRRFLLREAITAATNRGVFVDPSERDSWSADHVRACRRDVRNAKRNLREWDERFNLYQAAENALVCKRNREREIEGYNALCGQLPTIAEIMQADRWALAKAEAKREAKNAKRREAYWRGRTPEGWAEVDTSSDQEHDDATVPTWRNQP